MEQCQYEAHVEKFFGLPDSITEGTKIDADFGLLVNLLVTFESKSAQRLGKNLAETQHSVNTWKSMMRMELRRCEGLVSENLALLKLIHVLRPYIRDLNGENYDRPAAGLYQFDRTIDELAIEVEKFCNT